MLHSSEVSAPVDWSQLVFGIEKEQLVERDCPGGNVDMFKCITKEKQNETSTSSHRTANRHSETSAAPPVLIFAFLRFAFKT